MSAKHTPGPWVILNQGSPEPLQIARLENFESVAALRGLAPDAVQEANARLIAAAPELLEALQDLVEEFVRDTTELYGPDYDPEDGVFVKFARATIAKATGGAA